MTESPAEAKPGHPDRDFLLCLSELYQDFGSLEWWPAETVWEMMTGAILTQNTAWTNVELALDRLRQAAGTGNFTASWLLKQDPENIKGWIRPSGFFNQKTASLINLAQWFVSYGEDIRKAAALPLDDLRAELLSIRGVGPETCDSIVLYAAERPVFLVDTYTRRLLGRLGYHVPRSYELLRMNLETLVKAEEPWLDTELNLCTDSELLWLQEAHALIVEHCKTYCLKKARCTGCKLKKFCAQQSSDQVKSSKID